MAYAHGTHNTIGENQVHSADVYAVPTEGDVL